MFAAGAGVLFTAVVGEVLFTAGGIALPGAVLFVAGALLGAVELVAGAAIEVVVLTTE